MPRRSLNILKGHFEQDILKDQDPWATDEHAGRLLDLLPDKKLTTALRRKWDSAPGRSSSSKWADIDVLASTTLQDSGDASTSTSTSASRALLDAKIDIVLEYTYPRLDAEVSKKLNHLLKSPFCVHPATGRVCVPIDPLHVHAFDPAAVPIVTALLAEIDAWHAAHADPDPDADMDDGAADAPAPATGQKQRHALADYEKTSLKPHVDFFRAFVANLLNAESATDSEQDGATEAMQLDF